MRKNILPYLVSLLVSCIAAPAFAQQNVPTAPGFAIDRFDASEVGSDWFAGDSLDFRPKLRPAFGVIGAWTNSPLARYDDNGDKIASVIKNRGESHIQASLAFLGRFRLALNLPVLWWQSREMVRVDGLDYKPAKGVHPGDLRVSGDVRLFGEYGDAISLAIGAQFHVPTGNQAAYTGDGKIRIVPRLMLAGDISMFAYSVRASFDYRAQDAGFGGTAMGNGVAFVATAGLRLLDRALLVGPEIWGSTGVGSGTFFKRATTPFEVLLGGHYFLGSMRFGLGVGPGLTQGIGAPAYRVLGSVAYVAPAAQDRDGDGIYDNDDACPDTPGVEDEDPAKNGCPADKDEDGIFDLDDACPEVAGVQSDDPTKNGCPPDRDADGIYDDADACPDVPGVKNDDPEKNGCPPDRDGDGIYDDVDACPDVAGVESEDAAKNGCPADRDGDGIPDEEDACPDLAGVRNKDAAKNGCPPDRDGDGIYDKDDACPDVPGLENEDPEQNGCPLARVEEHQIKITQRIEFELNSAKLLPSSDPILEAVLAILQEHEEITQVLVQGHTDNTGKARHNLRLSKQRAASVVSWLTEHGVDKKRLRSEGKGSEVPLKSNDTDEGRQKNRRVEFHIQLINGKPPSADNEVASETTKPADTKSSPAADKEPKSEKPKADKNKKPAEPKAKKPKAKKPEAKPDKPEATKTDSPTAQPSAKPEPAAEKPKAAASAPKSKPAPAAAQKVEE